MEIVIIEIAVITRAKSASSTVYDETPNLILSDRPESAGLELLQSQKTTKCIFLGSNIASH